MFGYYNALYTFARQVDLIVHDGIIVIRHHGHFLDRRRHAVIDDRIVLGTAAANPILQARPATEAKGK